MKKSSNIIKNDKGITLIVLIITIIVMVILVGLTVNNGFETLYSSQLKGFYTHLEIVQKKVDEIVSTRKDYKTLGSSLTSAQTTKLNNILALEGAHLTVSSSSFRYFTISQLESVLGLSEMKYNVFVDFDNRIVIAEEGKKINGKMYYILNSKTYYVNADNTINNKFIVRSLEIKITSYGKEYYPNVISNTVVYEGTDNYKVTVIPINKSGNTMSGGTLKYKKVDNKQWIISDNLEFVIDELTAYDIEYIDSNNNKVSKTITVKLKPNGEPTYN